MRRRSAGLLTHAVVHAIKIHLHLCQDRLVRFGGELVLAPSFYRLFEAERDQDAEHNGAELLQKLAPTMDGLGLVNVHQRILASSALSDGVRSSWAARANWTFAASFLPA